MSGSGKSGMIEKAIENWLTNTNERNFLIPYCAVLSKLGHKVIYVSSNVQMEQGKDIITIDPNGEPCAFQLKSGKIDTAEWRAIKGEVDELIELPIVHPSVDKTKVHKSFLVTNSEFTDPVRIQITQRNEDNRQKGRNYSYLDTINSKTLLQQFITAQGGFTPIDLKEVQEFLGFYLADGRDFLDKEKFADFLEERVFAKGTGQVSNKINAVLASIPMTAFAMNNYQRHANHYAAFETWTLLAASIVRFANIQGLKNADWRSSFDLAMMEARRSLQLLKDEMLSRTDFLEGDWMGDGAEVYRARVTMVLGALSAFELDQADNNNKYSLDGRLLQMVENNLTRLWFWGEAAFPFFFSIIRFLERGNRNSVADTVRQGAFLALLRSNSPNSKAGLPPYHYSAHQVIENLMAIAEDPIDMENFTSSSYALPNFLTMSVRRQERAFLEQHWRRISHIRVHEFIPDNPIDVFRWHVKEGTNASHFLNETQSWTELLPAGQRTGNSWQLSNDFKPLLSFWILVAPHRCSEHLINGLDGASGGNGNSDRIAELRVKEEIRPEAS